MRVVTFTPTPTEIPTEAPTPTPTAAAMLTPTVTTNAQVTPVKMGNPAAPSSGAGIGNKVWFMGPLIDYFAKLGAYPPEAAPARPVNVNPLTGREVAEPALLQRRPILARLGNDPKVRPQTGLNEADLVFEEMIDQRNGVFALTRLTAVYLGQNGTLRPFRSGRPVNASLVPMLDGALAHSGASQGGRYLFSKLPWGAPLNKSLNLDDYFQGGAYCTIGADYSNRFAATVEHIHEYLASKGLEKMVSLRGLDFAPTPPSSAPVNSIAFDHLPWPINTGGVTQWNYDAATGRYLRWAGGVPHNSLQYKIAGKWGGACEVVGTPKSEQISAANVVVLNAEHQPTDIVEDANQFASVFIELTGSGAVKIFRDGVQIAGTWKRPTLQHFFQFVDASGSVIPLKPGNTWFELAPLNYAPTTR